MASRLVDSTSDPASGTPPLAKLGRYEIVKRLARGSLADLLLARTSGVGGFERHIAIKQLRDDQASDAVFVQMFVTEARLAGALHHHNIVQVQDIGEDNGRHYFAMEYVHGEDVRKLLARLYDRRQVLPIQHLITIGSAVAAALHHAHEQIGPDRKPLGIVHRDVTPANILVGYDGNVKVADFGIAKAAIRTIDTQVGMLKGKIAYMSPEQCIGQAVDRRSDVFALGVVLYELATVRRLFKGETEFLTMSAIVEGTVPRPSQHRKDLPGELDKIIMKALARDPAERYQTAAELRVALDGFATRSKMALSATALADYMKQLFGERPEPWLSEGEDTVRELVDFDHAARGLVKPSNAAVETFAIPPALVATADSPIVYARRRAVTDTPTELVSIVKRPASEPASRDIPRRGAGNRLPSPTRTPRSMPVAVPIQGVPRGKERMTTDVDETTDIANPPPPPPTAQAAATAPPATTAARASSPRAPSPPPEGTAAARSSRATSPPPATGLPPAEAEGEAAAEERSRRRAERDPTEIVTPLPSPLEPPPRRARRTSPAPAAARARTATSAMRVLSANRTWALAGIGALALVAVLLVVVIGFSSEGVTAAPAPAAREPAARAAPVRPAAPATTAPEPPRPERTVRNSEPPAPAVVDVQPEVIPPAPEVAPPPRPAPELAPPPSPPPVPEVAMPPVRATSAPVTRRPAPATRPRPAPRPAAKPAKAPTYDPDALFLRKP